MGPEYKYQDLVVLAQCVQMKEKGIVWVFLLLRSFVFSLNLSYYISILEEYLEGARFPLFINILVCISS